MNVWTKKVEAAEAIEALRNARTVLNKKEWTELRKKFIEIALRSYPQARTHFFQYLPEYK